MSDELDLADKYGCENIQQIILAHLGGDIMLTPSEMQIVSRDIGLRRLCFRPVTELDELFLEGCE